MESCLLDIFIETPYKNKKQIHFLQVQQLQESMDHVLRCVSPSSQSVAETQTDITAVKTPVEGSCPNANAITRPNFLPLSKSCTNQVVKTTNATAMSSDI